MEYFAGHTRGGLFSSVLFAAHNSGREITTSIISLSFLSVNFLDKFNVTYPA